MHERIVDAPGDCNHAHWRAEHGPFQTLRKHRNESIVHGDSRADAADVILKCLCVAESRNTGAEDRFPIGALLVHHFPNQRAAYLAVCLQLGHFGRIAAHLVVTVRPDFHRNHCNTGFACLRKHLFDLGRIAVRIPDLHRVDEARFDFRIDHVGVLVDDLGVLFVAHIRIRMLGHAEVLDLALGLQLFERTIRGVVSLVEGVRLCHP